MPSYLHWDSCSGDPTAQENHHGYPRVNQEMRKAFDRIGVEVTPEAQTFLYHGPIWPVRDLYRNRRNGIFSMWESSQISFQQMSTLRALDFAIAPCTYSAELFKPFVKQHKVLATPHGVNSDIYNPQGRTSGDGPFTVWCNAENGRKSWFEVAQAFIAAGIPNSRIIFKGKEAAKAAATVTARGAAATALTTYFPEQELADLYRSTDVCVAANRGEGWDMVAFEQMACGTPTIVPNHTAYLDWNHLAAYVLKDHHMENWENCSYGNAGPWYVPSVEEIAKMLWAVHDDTSAAVVAQATAELICTEYTWDRSARQIQAFLEPLEPLTDAGEKIPWEPELWVIGDLMQNWDVGGRRGRIVPGERKRVWLEEARVLIDARAAHMDPVQDWTEV